MRRMTEEEVSEIDRSLANWILELEAPEGVNKMEWMATVAHFCLMSAVGCTVLARAEGDESFAAPSVLRRVAESGKNAIIDETQRAFQDHQRRN